MKLYKITKQSKTYNHHIKNVGYYGKILAEWGDGVNGVWYDPDTECFAYGNVDLDCVELVEDPTEVEKTIWKKLRSKDE